ncbi:MAG: TRAP transporter permease [Clostridia bacterium]|nr:TRAP transporter permease [Clostridia bacterium]
MSETRNNLGIDFETVDEAEVQKVMEKYDRDSAVRTFSDYRRWIIGALCILFSVMQLYAGFTGKIPNTQLRPLHLGFVMTIGYLLYPATKKASRKKIPWYDIILALLSLGCCLYIGLQHIELANRYGKVFAPGQEGYIQYVADLAVGGLLIVLLVELCRRVVGIPILCVAGFFVIYGLFANYFPGFMARKAIKPTKIITTLVYSTEGIMGTPLGASASFIFLFVLFGAFLESTRVGEFFIDLSNAVAGHKRGGPAKVAVITSAFEGTVSGSSVANTVGSGSFTIPMMKKLGYKPEFAGAVEASASTGGQIMPPVMGAAAFLMAESVGVSYTEVVKAAIVPALLYFVGVYIIVELEARKCGLVGLKKENMPKLKRIMIDRGYLFVPLVVIIYFLSAGYTPIYGALVGIVTSALCGLVRRFHSWYMKKRKNVELYEDVDHDPKQALVNTGRDIVKSLENGARNVVSVAVACAVAGIVVGMITMTGLGQKLGNGLVDLAGGSKLLTLMLTMLASIILGMGVPTTANYLITSTVMAPAVMKVMGCDMLTAHMFTFYFGIVADITPPVALASMAGAAIAKSNPMKTGLCSVKLAMAAFLVPYIFVFNQKMLMIGAQWYEVLIITCTAIIGMIGVGVAVEGYGSRHAHPIQRILFAVGGILLVDAGTVTDIIGIVIIALCFLWQWAENKKFGGRLEPADEFYRDKDKGYALKESFVNIAKLFGKAE